MKPVRLKSDPDVKKANAARAAKHVKYRTKDWMILLTCLGIAGGIYGYTMYAMKQEQFLDDFEMPDPLEEDTRIKKHWVLNVLGFFFVKVRKTIKCETL